MNKSSTPWHHVGHIMQRAEQQFTLPQNTKTLPLDNSPRAAGAKRLAKTSRRAVHMASSSYRLLPRVPLKVTLFARLMPESGASIVARLPPLWRSSHRMTSQAARSPKVVCQERNGEKKQKTNQTHIMSRAAEPFVHLQEKISDSFPVRNTTDGRTIALSSTSAVLMAVWV